MKRNFVFILTLCLLCRCASLSKEAEKVTLVSDPRQVAGCKSLGQVKVHPPYSLPSDWKIKLRNAAAKLHGTHVLGDAGIESVVVGEVYECPAK